jgi:superfamily I DNA/RNA helicase
MKPSRYQQKILDWIRTSTGNATCNAVAGSGKSTTLYLAAQELLKTGISPSQIKIIVFGKTNADDLIRKFGSQWQNSISTLHSIGWTILKAHLGIGRGTIDEKKYRTIARSWGYIGKHGLKKQGVLENEGDFLQILNLLRMNNACPNSFSIRAIAEHHGMIINDYEKLAIAIQSTLEIGIDQAKYRHIFDFTDQIWLPVYWNAQAPQRKFVMVDESQDLNTCQTEIAIKLGKQGRILGVGDPKQSVYGFAGADCNSYENFKTRINAIELPLSICYRCPASHINLVNKIFPDIPIEASPTAETGTIEKVDELHPITGDLILCRTTAPLVQACIRLIGEGIAAKVKGKSIGEGLKTEAENIANLANFSYSRLFDFCYRYLEIKATKWQKLENREQLMLNLYDKLQALMAIANSNQQFQNINQLTEYINRLFSDDHAPVTLCTVHRAKGLEADRVWIIEPDIMPTIWKNQQDWQREQEHNLLYVALTRAKQKLFIVGDADWCRILEEVKELRNCNYDLSTPKDLVLSTR